MPDSTAVIGWRGIGLALEGPAPMVDEVVAHLPPFYDLEPPAVSDVRVFEEDGAFALEVDGKRPSHFVPHYPTLLEIANLLELLVVERLDDLVAIHAGVVVVDDGALLFPGYTQTGKSRLVEAFLTAGATYASDEFALLDAEGLVHPYPRHLGRRDGGVVRRIAVDSPVLSHPVPAAGVAFLEYAEDLGLALHELSEGDLWRRLMEHCIPARRRPSDAFAAVAAVARQARGLIGSRGEARDCQQQILEAFGMKQV